MFFIQFIILINADIVLYFTLCSRGVNRAEISGQARKVFAWPGPELIYYKICTMV